MNNDIKEKKTHRRGWFRSMYYYMGWRYDSDNDKPDERAVHLKQLCMRQISLSKLKLKETKSNIKTSPDLIPIRPNTPYPKNIIEKSLKQRNQIKTYKTKLEILKSL